MPETYRIGRVPIAITSVADVRERVLSTIVRQEKGYVCISNMRTVVAANHDPAYLAVMEQSMLNTPDGTPLVWCGRAWGLKQVQRVVGYDVFLDLLSAEVPHFFLGDTDETLAAVTEKARSGGAQVAGAYSPPFAPLEEYDLEDIAARIRASGAALVWVSLRAPKQDLLAAKLLPLLSGGTVMIGVGAAFRIYLGEYTLDRGWLEKTGLGGLKMLRNTTFWRELKWYISHGLSLCGYLISIVWKRIRGRSPAE